MTLDDLVGLKLLSGRAEWIIPGHRDHRQSFDTYEDRRCFALRLDDAWHVFQEDGNDGYRSMLGEIRVAPILESVPPGSVTEFAPFPVNLVKAPVYDPHDGYEGRNPPYPYRDKQDVLEGVDERTGHVVFRVGTFNTDDYYPSFVSQWIPPEVP